MLTQLNINNFGLIDKLSLELSKGLNVLTGETGAGKSILIDALRYGLGERLDSSDVRDKALSCTVELAFELPKKLINEHDILSEYISGDEPILVITRSYMPDGRSKIKVNGRVVTAAQLKQLGDNLVDLHGPHDHQMLLSSANHIGILDSLSDIEGPAREYKARYGDYKKLLKEQEEIKKSALSRERELDELSHRIKELSRMPLDEKNYEEIKESEKRITNSEKLYEAASELLRILTDEENSVSETLGRAFGPLKTLSALDEGARELYRAFLEVQSGAEGLIDSLNTYTEGLSFEPERAKEIARQSDAYYEIIRKYGPTLHDAKEHFEKAKKRHAFLDGLEESDEKIKKEISAALKELESIAQEISKERKKRGLALEKTIENELKELGIAHVKFECRISKAEFGETGQDEVIFYISPNAGEEMKPLSEIISSGEAARVMLALKKALIKVDPIPVLIFDEIDAQIGGRLGDILGKKLRELSNGRQVILITHLPQIAGYADNHFKVAKHVSGNRTQTIVELLGKEERVSEMAKMMSGDKESAVSVSHAREMLERGRKTKKEQR